MSGRFQHSAPSDLRAEVRHRADGPHTMRGISLRWQIGANSPEQGTWPPPADWNDGQAPYPHIYEVWINGEARQTVFLYWPAWDWTPSNSHWVDLGEEPDSEYSVKIRAKVDGQTAVDPEIDQKIVDVLDNPRLNRLDHHVIGRPGISGIRHVDVDVEWDVAHDDERNRVIEGQPGQGQHGE